MKRGTRALLVVVAVVVIGALAAGATIVSAFGWYRAPIARLATPTAIEVRPGEGLAVLAQRLYAAGIVDRPRTWSLLGRYEGKATRLRTGEYEVAPGTTPEALLDLLVSGKVVMHPITFVEGWTFAQALDALRAAAPIRRTLDGASGEQIMAKLGEPDLHPEGQLFPDTYLVARGTTDLDVLQLAHERLKRELAAAWEARTEGLPLQTPYEALILASIVEKETGAPEERPRIAGVFVNRLRLGMRLQTDPTVIYGLGAKYDGDIRTRDLKTDTPYNTYTRAGLPPTPIALPGRAALAAATHPDTTEALYFVASGLGDGRHVFSKTYAEHERAVQQLLARQRVPGAGGASGGATRGGGAVRK